MCRRRVLNCVLAEFLAAALEAKGNIDNRRLADAFHELDEDGSGYISRVSAKSENFGPAELQPYECFILMPTGRPEDYSSLDGHR